MQILQLETEDLAKYLEDNEYLDFKHPEIQALAKALFSAGGLSERIRIVKAFEFVRDEIRHSWDIQNPVVTQTAVEVLREKHGICYAKSNLLAALLRSQGIPTGFAYQKLILSEESRKYCIHAMNVVFVEGRWLRLDARGNKPGVNAQLDFHSDALAFIVDARKGEKDYPLIYTRPHYQTMATLAKAKDALKMYLEELPEDLEA